MLELRGRKEFSMRGTFITIALSGLLLSLASGCSTMDVDEMTPTSMNVVNHQPGTVAVVTSLGNTAGFRGWTATSLGTEHELVGKATEAAIRKSGIFAAVKPAGQADYVLEITYTDVSEPVFGFNLDATLEANWKLTAVTSKKVLWQQPISGSGEATFGDNPIAVIRARKAEERAAAAHIRAGLEAISKATLDLPGK
jgi:hypothetical protein